MLHLVVVNGVGVRGNPSRTEPNHRETNHKQSPASTPPEDPNKQEIEEEKNILQKLLSNMEKPKVLYNSYLLQLSTQ